ncbi:hypothetical protein L596_000915 [Steinernema carpocapsae]|uniref:Uncharacterized protein n=1 Tax=Steinernema carpocapsae TaxID=34508 RepID=A0A4U8UK93_STECR|nr:hypothetical protein L596_000915 [Steinernema carpocapsae]
MPQEELHPLLQQDEDVSVQAVHVQRRFPSPQRTPRLRRGYRRSKQHRRNDGSRDSQRGDIYNVAPEQSEGLHLHAEDRPYGPDLRRIDAPRHHGRGHPAEDALGDVHDLHEQCQKPVQEGQTGQVILACSLKADQATSLLDILEPSEKIKLNPALRAVQKNRNEAIGNLSKKAFLELKASPGHFISCATRSRRSRSRSTRCSATGRTSSPTASFSSLRSRCLEAAARRSLCPYWPEAGKNKSLAAEHHASDPQSPAPISAIGFNLYVDTLANVAALLEAEIPVRMYSCSAIVCCSEGSLEEEKFQLAQKLRKQRIATDVLHEKIGHILVIKEEGVVLVVDPSEQKDNGVLHVDEAILKVSSAGAPTSSRLRTADAPTSSPARQSTAFSATFSNVVWLHSSKKSSSERRKIEGQIQNHATAKDVVATFSGKQKIYVCICELPAGALRTFANRMDRSLTQLELAAVFNESGKLKQAASDIFSELKPLFGPDQAGEPIILYSMKDGYYRVIL